MHDIGHVAVTIYVFIVKRDVAVEYAVVVGTSVGEIFVHGSICRYGDDVVDEQNQRENYGENRNKAVLSGHGVQSFLLFLVDIIHVSFQTNKNVNSNDTPTPEKGGYKKNNPKC